MEVFLPSFLIAWVIRFLPMVGVLGFLLGCFGHIYHMTIPFLWVFDATKERPSCGGEIKEKTHVSDEGLRRQYVF